MGKLNIDKEIVDLSRIVARHIASSVLDFSCKRTTFSIERAILRLLGVEGANCDKVPNVKHYHR